MLSITASVKSPTNNTPLPHYRDFGSLPVIEWQKEVVKVDDNESIGEAGDVHAKNPLHLIASHKNEDLI